MDILLDKLRTKVRDLSAKPEKFLEVQEDVFEASKWVAKAIYDCTKAGENALFTADQSRMSLKSAPSTLPELIVEDFDEEQVFAGVEWQNQFVLEELDRQTESIATEGKDWSLLLSQGHSRKRKESSSEEEEDEDFQAVLAKKKKELKPEISQEESEPEVEEDNEDGLEGEDEEVEEEEEEEEHEDGEGGEADEDSLFDDPDFQHMSDSEGDDLPLFNNPDSDATDDDNEEKEGRKAAEKEKKSVILEKQTDDYMEQAMKNLRGRGRSEVEDKFFSLSDMEKFLDHEDKAAERRLQKEDEEEDNEGIDLFEDSDGNEEEGRAKYGDYFNDAEENENQPRATSKASKGEKKAKVAFDLLQDDNEHEEDDEEKDLGEMKSTFEEQQTRLKKKIKKMEEEAVTDKPWQMKGEIAGPARPENSLLEEHLDYDTVAKHAPIITEAVSRRLEDIILRRIKDKAWDDVERKIKPVEDPYAYKKKLVLDQEKSKLSLAEIYEQEYLKLKQGELDKKKKVSIMDQEDEKETPKEVEEIRRKMKSLFAKLDTLSHFHYTPKQISAEVKIVRNMPSIAMEDVAPVGTSEATLLAPQEMLERKTDSELTARSELTDTDRKRERRRKKAKQRAVQKEKEKRQKIADKLNPGLGNKYSKQKVIKELEQAEKKGHVTLIKDKGKDRAVKSSTAFFDALQDDANSMVKNRRPEQAKKSMKASSLKL